MRKLLAAAAIAAAIVQPAVGQDKLGSGTTQIIVEPKTPLPGEKIKPFLKSFDATVLKDIGKGQSQVIAVPSDKAADFVKDLKTLSPSTIAQILSQSYTSLFQPALSAKLTDEQAAAVSELSKIGPTSVVLAPPPKFAISALSQGFGPAEGFGTKKSVALNLDNQWLVAVDSKLAPGAAPGAATWFTRIKGETGGVNFTVAPDGVRGTVRKGRDLFLVEPLGVDASGLDLQAVIKFVMPPVSTPQHPPSPRLTPVGKPAFSSQRAVTRPEISILFAYTLRARYAAKAMSGPTGTPTSFSERLCRETDKLRFYSGDAWLSYKFAGVMIDIGYDEKLSFRDLLDKIVDRKSGFLSEVHEERKKKKANIVAIMVSDGDGCGEAAQIGASRETAFVVVKVSAECLFYKNALGHEIGHLHGLVHETFDVERPGTVPPFKFGYGYRHDPTWRSPMAKEDCLIGIGDTVTDCLRISWTNPRIPCPDVICRDDMFGSPGRSDEVRVLEGTAEALSKY